MPDPKHPRHAYPYFRSLTSRWRDNDVFGHLNNAVYYEYVDTLVNNWVIDSRALPIPGGSVIGLVAETQCRFHAALSYPGVIDAGLRVARIGASSVTYEVGLFSAGQDVAAAEARFVHVYVDRLTHRPVPIGQPSCGVGDFGW